MIKKEYMTDYGVKADIWKLGYVSLDRFNKYGSVTMCLYLNKEATKYIHSIVEPITEPEVFDKYFESEKDIYQACEEFMIDNSEFFKEGIIVE